MMPKENLEKVVLLQIYGTNLIEMSDRLFLMSQSNELYNNPERSEKIKKIMDGIDDLKNDLENDCKESYRKLKEKLGES
jgi:hypothetical protein